MMNDVITRTIHMTKQCALCGKNFDVELLEETIICPSFSGTNFVSFVYTRYKILTDCFYGGKIRFGIGDWTLYRLEKDKNGNFVWKRCYSRWRELWYRLIDLKRLILHQYTEMEYFECPECFNKIKKGKINEW